ncbi:MAG: hypothetical protein EHM40_03390 [Chloroflexi bacterium]|nr:MAG: hypothetical protein EHM40_03390 [Chloroflexota bacterium]
MGLTNAYTVAVGRIPDLFEKIRDGQAPELFTTQLLKDWGFASSNDRAFIPLLKELGFLSPDGKPTSLYHEYRDHSRSKAVMAQGIRNAYGDIFLIKEHPTENDKDVIQGKFKSFHNVSDHVASLMTKTFLALLKLSDLHAPSPKKTAVPESEKEPKKEDEKEDEKKEHPNKPFLQPSGLFYNIQIHLPATKDVEVYNAIFKSLREHLIED